MTLKGRIFFFFRNYQNRFMESVGKIIDRKIPAFLRPSHTYISMLPLSTTWAGGHSKTNIPDIMYISDFYSSSFLHADHETIDWTDGL